MTSIRNFWRIIDGLKEYLLEQEKKERSVKPFACPFLVVLSEPISIGGKGLAEFDFEAGSLLCLKQIGRYPEPGRCEFGQIQVRFNKDGQMELTCHYNNSKFILSLVEFKPRLTYDQVGEKDLCD